MAYKTPIEMIFDYINLTSTVLLDYQDFIISAPTPFSKRGIKANTAITITPKTADKFYNTKTVYYNRMDLNAVLGSLAIEVIPTVETRLSELIPKINDAYGITLTEDDYVEQTLPLYNPATGVPARVTIMSKTSSYLFYGNYSLLLGANNVDVVDETGVTRLLYIQKSGYTFADYNKMVTCIKTDGTPHSSFSFMRNASNVTDVVINQVIVNNNHDLLVSGIFKMSIQNFGDIDPTVVDAKVITVGIDGAVKGFSSVDMRNNIDAIATAKDFDNFYILDKTATTQRARLFKFLKDGSQDITYETSGINYIPDIIRLSGDGTLYTVSPAYSDQGAKIRIDRLLGNGLIDPTFNPIVLGNTAINTAMPVVNIYPVKGAGLCVLLNPARGVSSLADTPIVNGINVVPGGGSSPYAWNPVLRFTQNGSLDTSFKNVLVDFDPKSILDGGGNLTMGSEEVVAKADSVLLYTYKTNPVNGFTHRQPIVFDDTGSPKLLSGYDYAETFRWTDSKNVLVQSNGAYLGYGKLLPRLSPHGWGDFVYAICRYSAEGAPVEVLYREDNTDLVNTSVSIVKVLLSETTA